MKLITRLFGPKPQPVLIYQPGQRVGSVDPVWPVIECPSGMAQKIIAQEAHNRDITPIILGSMRSLELIHEAQQASDPANALRRSSLFDFDAWMRQAHEEWAEAPDMPPRGPVYSHAPHGDAIDMAVWNPLTSAPFKTVYIGLFPTADVTQIPGLITGGGWNSYPEAGVHIALHRRWRDRYGARLIGHGHDTMTFHVLRPPRDLAGSLDLAEEFYAYCPDLIDQGFGNLDTLAAALRNAPTWHFWWD